MIIRPKPIMNVGETFPLMRSSRELENTIKAMHAGSIQMNVVTA
jgi:hypothetical protein